MTVTLLGKIESLQSEINELEMDIHEIAEAISLLDKILLDREKELAYTGVQSDTPTFKCDIDLKYTNISIKLPADVILAQLKKDTRVDELKLLKVKVAKIEKLLEE